MAEVEMTHIGENSRLVENQEVPARLCSFDACPNEALYRCEMRIWCKKYGCRAVVCEEHKNQEKICGCLDQKELISCLICEPLLKDKASKGHFFIPALVFMIINVLVWVPVIIIRLKELQQI